MKSVLYAAAVIVLLALESGCDGRAHSGALPASAPYDLSTPDAAIQLHHSLSEVSGIVLLDSARLAAVEDEHGIVYVLDRRTGAIQRQIPFAALGDYEDIALAGDRLFTLLSDGTVTEVLGWASGAPRARRFGSLPVDCDAEGLGLDPAEHRLLVACKFRPPEAGPLTRPVYAFPLADTTAAPVPAFEMDVRAVHQHPNYDGALDRAIRTFTESFRDLSGFRPSAIAVHPATGLIHVLSSDHKAIVVLDRTGRVLDVWKLPSRIFRQPEGMAFAPDGTLYISNEGPNGTATLLTFTQVRSAATPEAEPL